MFGLGVLCTAVLTLVTPVAARLSVGTFLAVRVLEGIGEVCIFKVLFSFFNKIFLFLFFASLVQEVGALSNELGISKL